MRLFVAQRGRRSKCIRKWCVMIFRRVIVKSIEDNSNECRGHSVLIGKGSWSRRRHMKEPRLNRSWSKGSSSGASDRDVILVISLQQGMCHDYT